MKNFTYEMQNGPTCQYASLEGYNNDSNKHMNVPQSPMQQANSGSYVVPSYGINAGYNTLTHGQSTPSCNGYFGIGAAYGVDANNREQQYVRKMCR